MDAKFFSEVVLPTLLKKLAALFAISTPLGSTNWYNKIMKLRKADGSPMWASYVINLVCNRLQCQEDNSLCDISHVAWAIPPWHGLDKHEKIRETMIDDAAQRQRELYGLVADETEPCFVRQYVIDLFRERFVYTNQHVREVIIAIDPNAGSPSHYAIVTAYYAGPMMVVCYLLCCLF